MKEIPWLFRQLNYLSVEKAEMQKIVEAGNSIAYSVGAWTLLKLIFLRYAASVYSKIIPSVYENCYYVDLMSDSGVNQVREVGDYFLGSPLIISKKTFPRKFKKLFFCESNVNSANALEARLKLDLSAEEFQIFQKDCNQVVDEITHQFEQPYHSLIFVDPFAMEVHWETMEKLLELKADIIMNFQTANAPRGQHGKPFKAFFRDSTAATTICETVEQGEIRNALLNMYMADVGLSGKRKDAISIPINIHGGNSGSFEYDLLFITRKTKGKNLWLNAILGAKQHIEGITDKDVKKMLDILFKRQTTLEKIDFSRQKRLGEF